MIKIIDPRKSAVGSIKETLEKYPHIQHVLPAIGYNDQQIKDLEETINSSDADVVLSATPIDLSKVIKTEKPIIRVSYKLDPEDSFYGIIDEIIQKLKENNYVQNSFDKKTYSKSYI